MLSRHAVARLLGAVGFLAAAGLVGRELLRRTPADEPVMVGDCWPPVPLKEDRVVPPPDGGG